MLTIYEIVRLWLVICGAATIIGWQLQILGQFQDFSEVLDLLEQRKGE